jgi:threonine aldolase
MVPGTTDVESPSRVAPVVDLRSDTVTKPTPAMRRAMAEAEVGDDVYGEDPTVNALQARAAEMFGREAALFVPSGSMGNLVAIKTWTHHGGEVICDERAHINQFELSSMAAIAGCLPRTARAPDGILTWELIEPLIRPQVYYRAQTALVALENTHNLAGGSVYSPENCSDICERAHAEGLLVHMDGARIFNAAIALRRSVAELTRQCDSVMFCLSKGLGAPSGSLLLGSREFISKAHICRKMLGGGMRQVGVLAAAGLVALEQTPAILHVDHENAQHLAAGLARLPGVRVEAAEVVTNIVIFDVQGTGRTASELCAALVPHRVLASPFEKYVVRMVTHYDVDRAGIERALAALHEILKQNN